MNARNKIMIARKMTYIKVSLLLTLSSLYVQDFGKMVSTKMNNKEDKAFGTQIFDIGNNDKSGQIIVPNFLSTFIKNQKGCQLIGEKRPKVILK